MTPYYYKEYNGILLYRKRKNGEWRDVYSNRIVEISK